MTSRRTGSTKKWPLEGIKVLDLGQIYNGPYAGFLLAHAGADVVKVEPLSGEVLRERGEERCPCPSRCSIRISEGLQLT